MGADRSGPSEDVRQSRQISIRVPRTPIGTELADDSTAEEPLSPTARLMEGICIVVMIGLDAPLNLPLLRAGFEAQLRHYPRFRSIQVTDGYKDGEPRWVRTTVKFEEHITFPTLDPDAVTMDPDKVVEDYVATLPTLPMDGSRPPWELHLLDFPTSEATSTVVMRAQHSLGDGMSLMAFLMASARSAADPTSSPAMLPTARRAGALYARSAGATAFIAWVWSGFVLSWHTVVDVALFVATILFLRDPRTLFKGAEDNVLLSHGKRFAHRTLSLDDIKIVKNAMNCVRTSYSSLRPAYCSSQRAPIKLDGYLLDFTPFVPHILDTVNDVLVGLTSAALSRYYFRKSGDTNTRKISLRSIIVANIRQRTGLQSHDSMVECGKSNDVTWGNKLGYIILPFHIAMHDDQMAYIREAKKMVERKKRSLEVIMTQKILAIFLKCFGLKAAAFIARRVLGNTTLLFSNMIGPVDRIELWGHTITFIAPTMYGPGEASHHGSDTELPKL
uniref:Diacylglycerol O-acyltransferase n=1 Tax=Hordeum vulgare subsp. vulgare TaxID=112509 RepID=A0A8I7B4Q8_HORVV